MDNEAEFEKAFANPGQAGTGAKLVALVSAFANPPLRQYSARLDRVATIVREWEYTDLSHLTAMIRIQGVLDEPPAVRPGRREVSSPNCSEVKS